MSKICVFSHFCSCNLGDRNQGKAIVKYFLKQTNFNYLNIKCVNFYDISDNNDDNISIEEIGNTEHIVVYGPSFIMSKNILFDDMIVVSGTMNYDSDFFHVIHRLSNNITKNIFIWGGFYNNNIDKLKNINIFNKNNIHFISRSYTDIEIYRQLNNNKTFVGSDPLIYYALNKQGRIDNCIDLNDNKICDMTNKKIYIPCLYFYRQFPKIMSQLISHADVIICVDNSIDTELVDLFVAHDKPFYFIHDPELFMQITLNAKIIVSNRLHCGILSSINNVNTIVIPCNNFIDNYDYDISVNGLFNDPVNVAVNNNNDIYETYDVMDHKKQNTINCTNNKKPGLQCSLTKYSDNICSPNLDTNKILVNSNANKHPAKNKTPDTNNNTTNNNSCYNNSKHNSTVCNNKYVSVFNHSYDYCAKICKIIDVDSLNNNYDFFDKDHTSTDFTSNCTIYANLFYKSMQFISDNL